MTRFSCSRVGFPRPFAVKNRSILIHNPAETLQGQELVLLLANLRLILAGQPDRGEIALLVVVELPPAHAEIGIDTRVCRTRRINQIANTWDRGLLANLGVGDQDPTFLLAEVNPHHGPTLSN